MAKRDATPERVENKKDEQNDNADEVDQNKDIVNVQSINKDESIDHDND